MIFPSFPEDYKGPSDLNREVERTHLQNLLDCELKDFLADYSEPVFEGMGGSGVVFSAIFTPHGTRRAIKVPRHRLYTAPAGENVASEDPEIHALTKLSHKNITRLYAYQPLKSGCGSCMITEYVESALPIHIFAKQMCSHDRCHGNEALLSDSILQVVTLIREIADAVCYMHNNAKLIHFDLKPDNILVGKNGIPYVTDLGLARDITKYKPEDIVPVGFTWKYAHRRLTDPHAGARVSQTPAKSSNSLFGKDLSPVLDIYAFGRTIQEILKTLEFEHGENIYSCYQFNYIHIVSCLCLDGSNAPNHHMDETRSFVSDQALGMPISFFVSERYSSVHSILCSIDRLLGARRIEDELPELDPWAAQTIKVSDVGITALTPRLRRIINHPSIRRLGDELQLGMLDNVFPTATHTRLQHTLGVYHAVGNYISALYYDHENPTFRIVFNPKDGRRALVAALIHDCGQATFGHDLEDVSDAFSHQDLSKRVINSELKDDDGHTLRNIIEDENIDGWNVNVADVLGVLTGSSTNPIDGVLHDILDGPLDGDKLDYLMRDSTECRVKYGCGLDVDRLLRSLTVVCIDESGRAQLHLGIKRKGVASADSFSLARYQLYQSVYWHHTFRAAKSMFSTAVSSFICVKRKSNSNELFAAQTVTERVIDQYCTTVLGIEPVTETRTKGKTAKVVKGTECDLGTGRYASDQTIRMFFDLANGKDKEVLHDVANRHYYKRVYETPLGTLAEEAWIKLRDTFRSGEQRLALRERCENSIMNALRTRLQDVSQVRESLIKDHVLEKVGEVATRKYCVLIDLPIRGWSTGGRPPLVVSDYKRRYLRADAGGDFGREEGMPCLSRIYEMMRDTACFRVFCEPEIHGFVMRALTTQTIHAAIEEACPELRKRRSGN